LVRFSSSLLVAAGRSAGKARSRRSVPATSSVSRPARNIGTEPRDTTAVTHIAIQEEKDGKVVDWMEHVSDGEYKKGSGAE